MCEILNFIKNLFEFDKRKSIGTMHAFVNHHLHRFLYPRYICTRGTCRLAFVNNWSGWSERSWSFGRPVFCCVVDNNFICLSVSCICLTSFLFQRRKMVWRIPSTILSSKLGACRNTLVETSSNWRWQRV